MEGKGRGRVWLLLASVPRSISGRIGLSCPPHSGDTKRWCASDVCLSRTSGLSREPRGLGRLKLARRQPTSHVTRTPLSRSKVKGQVAGAGAYCGGLPHSLLSRNASVLQFCTTEAFVLKYTPSQMCIGPVMSLVSALMSLKAVRHKGKVHNNICCAMLYRKFGITSTLY